MCIILQKKWNKSLCQKITECYSCQKQTAKKSPQKKNNPIWLVMHQKHFLGGYSKLFPDEELFTLPYSHMAVIECWSSWYYVPVTEKSSAYQSELLDLLWECFNTQTSYEEFYAPVIFRSAKASNAACHVVLTCLCGLSSPSELWGAFCPESTIKEYSLPSTIYVYIQNHPFWVKEYVFDVIIYSFC